MRYPLAVFLGTLLKALEVGSIAPGTVRRALKKRVEAVVEAVLVHPPPQANAAFVHNMEDVLEVYQHPQMQGLFGAILDATY